MFTLDDDIMCQLRATFQVEAAERVQAMNRVLLALEDNPEGEERQQLFEEIFREAHSLKGAAGAADIGEAEAIAHRLESVFGAAKAGKITLTHDLCDVLYEGIDAITVAVEATLQDKPHGLDLPSLYTRLDEAEQGRVAESALRATPLPAPQIPEEATDSRQGAFPSAKPEPKDEPLKTREGIKSTGKSESSSHPSGPTVEETIRVATGKLDSLMTQAGELLVAGLKIDQRLNEVGALGHSMDDWNREWLKLRAATSSLVHTSEHEALRPLVKLLDMNQEWLKAMSAQIADLQRGFARDALHLSRVTNDLGEGVMRVRMLPVSTVFDALPRLVRDLAREAGKEVDLQMEGRETELDRKVLEAIKDPLIHLLRNSVDHGIEPPEDRARMGKPRQGTVTVKAFQKGSSIVIEVADDGAGIGRKKVKQAALKAGLISTDELETISDEEALRLIFAPGLSTSPIVTDISGRGVGMDIVRKNVEALQGQVDVDSTLGRGCRITLTLPLTLATTQELLVQVDDQTFGIPISAVETILRIQRKDISTVGGRQAIAVDDEPVSLVRLAQVLERPDPAQQVGADQKVPVVILGSAKKRIAFWVDAVVGRHESVIKSLGKQLARVRNVAGVTILGTGQVIMALNPADLIKSARQMEGRAIAGRQVRSPNGKTAKQSTILIVDDSLSTRTMEKSILETAGYKVVVATDGLEAMSILQSNGGCDLIVSDVLMPRMGGFDLTAAVKGTPHFKKIPVVLVTSLESRADKERGIEVGADAYIVKSNFDQANLLQTIAQLI